MNTRSETMTPEFSARELLHSLHIHCVPTPMEEICARLGVLVELDRILSDQGDAPYVLERHEQMDRRIADAQKEISFLLEQQKLSESERRQLSGTRVGASRTRKSGKV